MNKTKDRAQGVAVFIVALGAVVYIAADLGFSGFESFKKLSFFNAPAQQETISTARATNEIRNELLTISKNVTSKQSELEDISSKLSSIKLEIANRLSELKKISKVEARGISELALTADNKAENRADRMFQKFSHLSDVQAASTAWNIGEYVFETVSENERQLQNFSLQNPFATDSAYLKPVGLRWAQIISKAARDLESKKVAVRFDKSNSVNSDRAEVVRNYLAKLVGEKVSVKLEGTEPNLLRSQAGVDVLIELKNQQGDQQ